MNPLAWLLAAPGLLALAYLALRQNRLWIHRCLDRSLRNARDRVQPSDELPRYLALDPAGRPIPGARWPGWDGWYVVALPEGDSPVKMLRGSVMTGLYGLDGIDNGDELRRAGLSSSDAAEVVHLVHREDDQGRKITERLQAYLPRASALHIERERLSVEVGRAGEPAHGRVEGAWPTYSFTLNNPETGVSASLTFHGERLLWWADVPGVFTYFAVFGRFEGTLRVPGQGGGGGGERALPIRGQGSFEHGFARRLLDFDLLLLPVRATQRLLPGLKPIRYHYELFFGRGGLRGGFMRADGFGIAARDQGGLYLDDAYVPIDGVSIEYLEEPPPEPGEGSGAALFHRSWRVRASTAHGPLDYVARREWPAMGITGNMMYYHYRFNGVYRGQVIQGSGYGEYLHL